MTTNENKSYRTVGVRALPRPGFTAYHRGGHRWPDDPPRVVKASADLLELLRAEKRLAVDLEPKGEPEAAPLDLNEQKIGHNSGSAALVDEVERLKADNAALKLEGERKRLAEENAKLKGELAAAQAAGAKASAAKGGEDIAPKGAAKQ